MNPKSLFLLLGSLVCLASPALADTITVTSGALPTMTLCPSNDSINVNAGHATLSGPGSVVFQTGNFYVGNSPIPDQVIPFFFNDTVTINGVSRTFSISGQDDVTSAADTFTIFAGAPVDFGSYILNLNASTSTGNFVGQNLPLNLTADITAQTPEPASLLLLATGLVGGAIMTTRFGRPAPRF